MEKTIELSTDASRREFWHRWVRLLVTIAAQNIIVYGVNLLDNIMIGKLGAAAELAISGVFIVNQIQFLLQSICGSISDGTVVICSRYWGGRRHEQDKARGSYLDAVRAYRLGRYDARGNIFTDAGARTSYRQASRHS